MGAQQSSLQQKLSSEDLSVVREETGLSDNEVERLFERFCELDREDKGFLVRTDFLAIPEIALNPVGDRIVHAFFKEGNRENKDLLATKDQEEKQGVKDPEVIKETKVFRDPQVDMDKKGNKASKDLLDYWELLVTKDQQEKQGIKDQEVYKESRVCPE